ncbi:hypothetical protein emb_1c0650 [Coriobacteriaceae bacterium EMTCatB1]|nr:hypothetical protein emb_1c0650 [Coriobacteriaceae bacterium EMTCatB1]
MLVQSRSFDERLPSVNACPHIGICYMTSDEAGYSPEFARIIRSRYCRRDFSSCARYQAGRSFGNPSLVPENLLPTEGQLAC